MKVNVKIVGLGTAGKIIVKKAQKALKKTDCQNVEFYAFENTGYAGGFNGQNDYSRERVLSTQGYDEYTPVLLLLVGGLGGHFASFEIPALARFAKDRGFDVGILASTPFRFEGNRRKNFSDEAVCAIKRIADFFIPFNNADLLKGLVTETNVSLEQAFAMQDSNVVDALKSLVKLFAQESLIALDYADVRALWCRGGNSFTLAKFESTDGEDVAAFAGRCKAALSRLKFGEDSYVIVQIFHGPNFTIMEYSQFMETIYECFGDAANTAATDTNVIIADSKNEDGSDKIMVCVLYNTK